MASLLFHNKRDGTFEEVGLRSSAALTGDGRAQAGMGVGAADYDRDGWLDIVKTNSTTTPRRSIKSGDGTFEDATFPSGLGVNTRFLGWGVGFLDVDRDGWPSACSPSTATFTRRPIASAATTATRSARSSIATLETVVSRMSPHERARASWQRRRRAAAVATCSTPTRDIVVNNVYEAEPLARLHTSGASGGHALVVQLEEMPRQSRSAIGTVSRFGWGSGR